MTQRDHSPAASATSLLIPTEGGSVLQVRPRIPLRASALPPGLVRAWERIAGGLLMLVLVALWLLR